MHDAGWQRAPHTSSDATTSTMQTYNRWITCQAREFQDFSILVIELTLVHRGLGRQRDYGPTRMLNSPRAGTGPQRNMCQQDAESLWCWQRHRSCFTRCQHPGHRTYKTRKKWSWRMARSIRPTLCSGKMRPAPPLYSHWLGRVVIVMIYFPLWPPASALLISHDWQYTCR